LLLTPLSAIAIENKERWVVEFAQPAVGSVTNAMKDPAARMRTARALASSFKALREDLTSLTRSALSSSGDPIVYEYRNVLAGAVIEASGSTMKKLRQKPYIAAIHADRQMELSIIEGRKMMHINQALERYKADGTGVRVAVIDSGIDYMHAALGGGFGQGHRVYAGYDYVNGDPDPMDDHGHGTSVAGIIGSNDAVYTGVAPNCQIMALKVISSSGMGRGTDVLAALEHAVDPDGDPATDDGAQVANLSLGSKNGTASDYVARAVDNASNLGMIVCAAAGNNGAGEGCINTPASARKSIAVGSFTLEGYIPLYTSWGPTLNDYLLKPDIAADGCLVKSTVRGGGFDWIGCGTSLSTPFVAGSAAVLRQLHPDWPSDWIKAALINNADDFGNTPLVQGSGLLNLKRSCDAQFVASPATISCGIDDKNQPLWSFQQPLKVTNVTTQTLTLHSSIHALYLPEGALAYVEPRELQLKPHETGQMFFNLALDNTLVPDFPYIPFSHFGAVQIDGGDTHVMVPFSIVVHPEIRLQMQSAPWTFELENQAGFTETAEGDDHLFARLRPSGFYNLGMLLTLPEFNLGIGFGSFLHTNRTVLNIQPNLFPHRYQLNVQEPNGEPLPLSNCMTLLRHGSTMHVERNDQSLLAPPAMTDLDKECQFEWHADQFQGQQLIEANGYLHGPINSNRAADVEKSDYGKISIEMKDVVEGSSGILRPNLISIAPATGIFTRQILPQAQRIVATPGAIPWYYLPTNPQQFYRYRQIALYSFAQEPLLLSPIVDFSVSPPKLLAPAEVEYPIGNIGDTLTLGSQPLFFCGRFYYSNQYMHLHHWAGVKALDVLFSGPEGDYSPAPISWRQWGGEKLQTPFEMGRFQNGDDHVFEGICVGAIPTKTTIDFEPPALPQACYVAGIYTGNADNTPPYLKRMDMLVNGKSSSKMNKGDAARLEIDAYDEGTISTVAAWICSGTRTQLKALAQQQPLNEPVWQQPLKLSQTKSTWSASIPSLSRRGNYAILIQAQDETGNKLRMLTTEAFTYENGTQTSHWRRYR